MNEFGKVAGYKISTQKSVAFLYTNNEKSEREIQETIPFTIASSSSSKATFYQITPNIPLTTEAHLLFRSMDRRIPMS